MKVNIVIAGNHSEYERFLHVDVPMIEGEFRTAIRRGLNRHPRNDYKYFSRPEQLNGYHPETCEVKYTGRYWANPIYKSDILKRFDPNPPKPKGFWGVDYGMMEQATMAMACAGKDTALSMGQLEEAFKLLGKEFQKATIQTVSQVHDSILLEIKTES